MATEFVRLADVPAIEEIKEEDTVLVVQDGDVKRAPKTAVGGGVEVASTAEVGQTIVVKAVDENGKPTEWECDDLDLFITFDSNTFREDGYYVVLAATNNLCEKIQQMYNNHRYRDIALYDVSIYDDQPAEITKYSCDSLRAPYDGDGWHLDCGTFVAMVYPNNRIDVQYYD